MPTDPGIRFRLDRLLQNYLPAQIARLIAPSIESVLGLRDCEQLYAGTARARTTAEFALAVLDGLDLRRELRGAYESIPKSGPLIVVANHPFGGIEGLYLYSMLAGRRDDARLLANRLLGQLPCLAPCLFQLDVFGGADAVRRNSQPLRQALRWVRQGGSLIIFPAGEVATVDRLSRLVVDPPWSDAVARLIRLSGAEVVPIFVDGANSALFHVAGMLHPRLRTALLPREMIKRRGTTLAVTVGTSIAASTLQKIEDDRALSTYLRIHVYALACGAGRPMLTAHESRRFASTLSTGARAALQPLAEPTAVAEMAQEVANLHPDQRLARSGSLEVWCAASGEIPGVMREIGRLREMAFRAVGEGTGRARDLDLYDQYYDQLFLWDRATSEVVGGYRLCRIDEVRRRFGIRGLYSHSLFTLPAAVLNSLGPALEVGRSFVREDRQRGFAPMLLLWKAIGAYVCATPRYRVLVGAVSISRDYSAASSAMITGFLGARNSASAANDSLRPRNPIPESPALRLVKREATALGDLDALESIITSLEHNGKGVPVLLRQYLKLGARVLGFNLDPAFGHSIDVLIAVDLMATDATILSKYMGAERAAAFRAANTRASANSDR